MVERSHPILPALIADPQRESNTELMIVSEPSLRGYRVWLTLIDIKTGNVPEGVQTYDPPKYLSNECILRTPFTEGVVVDEIPASSEPREVV